MRDALPDSVSASCLPQLAAPVFIENANGLAFVPFKVWACGLIRKSLGRVPNDPHRSVKGEEGALSFDGLGRSHLPLKLGWMTPWLGHDHFENVQFNRGRPLPPKGELIGSYIGFGRAIKRECCRPAKTCIPRPKRTETSN